MELTKRDTQMAKGIAIVGMVMLHLFCRLDSLPYTPRIYIGNIPLIYYFGLFGDLCVPVFCFCSGYAHNLIYNKNAKKEYIKKIPNKILRFLINFWIVLIIFTLLGLLFDQSGRIPGSLNDFFCNAFLIKNSYNGAWWFVLTYILLLVASPVTAAIVNKIPDIVSVLLSLGLYFAAYVFSHNYIVEIDNGVLAFIWRQILLIGTSQFTYIIGMLAFKNRENKFFKKLFNKEYKKNLKIILSVLIFLFAFAVHGIEWSLFIAPFTAIAALISLYMIKLPKVLERVLLFLGKHSTNVWLIHLFFISDIFGGLVFIAKYPILIILLVFAICIPISYAISWICNKLIKAVKLK